MDFEGKRTMQRCVFSSFFTCRSLSRTFIFLKCSASSKDSDHGSIGLVIFEQLHIWMLQILAVTLDCWKGVLVNMHHGRIDDFCGKCSIGTCS